MKLRRLRLLLLSLFLTATVASALHTIEHQHHSADNCPICLVAEHTASGDVIMPFEAVVVSQHTRPSLGTFDYARSHHSTLPPARAPPSHFPISIT